MELVALAPDVILGTGTPVTSALQQASLSVPIVFAQVPDPVANGFVASLARPGGNTTGFTTYDYAASAKWVEVVKEIAPGVTRAAVLRDPTIASGIGQLGAVLAVAPSLGMELSPIGVRDAGEISSGHRATLSMASTRLGHGRHYPTSVLGARGPFQSPSLRHYDSFP